MVERRSERRNAPQPSEPPIIPCLLFAGAPVEVFDPIVRIAFWSQLPTLGGEAEEKRIAARMAGATESAADLFEQWKRLVEAKNPH